MKNRRGVHSVATMRLGLLLIGFISFLGAGSLWVTYDPWKQASLEGASDARAIHDVQARPDRVGFLISQDPALMKAVAWSDAGKVVYPGPLTYSPTRFELPLKELEELTRLTAGEFAPGWSDYDRDGAALLYCQPAPRICLIYDRDALQTALPLSMDGVYRAAMAVLLTVIGLLNLLLFWRRGTAIAEDDRLVLLPKHHSARRGKLEVALTPRDFRLLAFLQTRKGMVVTKDELYDAGWGREFMPNSRALDQHMINLRKKLDPDKSRSPVIETVRGVGYRLLE